MMRSTSLFGLTALFLCSCINLVSDGIDETTSVDDDLGSGGEPDDEDPAGTGGAKPGSAMGSGGKPGKDESGGATGSGGSGVGGTDNTGGSMEESSGGSASGGESAAGGAAGSGGAPSSGGGPSSGGEPSSGGASASGGSGPACTNIRPTGTEWDAATCDQWRDETPECDNAWMVDNNYCNESCGRCSN